MTHIASHGIRAEVPAGWDGRIYRRSPEVVAASAVEAARHRAATTHAVFHAASFPLPVERGDFGGGAVELMAAEDTLVALVEYHPDSVGTALFRSAGVPRSLDPRTFSPTILQRLLPGQGGTQAFFNESGRAWCLYVVLGSFRARAALVPKVNAVLDSIRIDPLGAP